MVQIKLQILAIGLLRTTTSFTMDQLLFLVGKGPIGQQNETCGAIGPSSGGKEPPTAEAP